MTLTIFLFIFFIGATAASLFTEALKKVFLNISSNILALASSGIVGVGGTFIAYILMDIPLDSKNIACIILMAFCIWLGSMVGYDKVIQTIEQLKGGGLS